MLLVDGFRRFLGITLWVMSGRVPPGAGEVCLR
jgi:hypothetical protein